MNKLTCLTSFAKWMIQVVIVIRGSDIGTHKGLVISRSRSISHSRVPEARQKGLLVPDGEKRAVKPTVDPTA